jgi:LPS sulfotransferase NodH
VDTSRGYMICATPRTGSTFLCSLLTATKVLGSPKSYFREPDELTWARRFGLRTEGPRVLDYRLFCRAVRDVARTPNGTFGARLMWGAFPRIRQGLEIPPHQSDLGMLHALFGPLCFVHLHRRDVVAQAVSWARAEQTGFWQHGDDVQRTPEPDLDQMVQLVRTIREHNDAWRSWFEDNEVEPYELAYEDLVSSPDLVVRRIADRVGVAAPLEKHLAGLPRRQSDHVNEEWSVLLRSALARSDP